MWWGEGTVCVVCLFKLATSRQVLWHMPPAQSTGKARANRSLEFLRLRSKSQASQSYSETPSQEINIQATTYLVTCPYVILFPILLYEKAV